MPLLVDSRGQALTEPAAIARKVQELAAEWQNDPRENELEELRRYYQGDRKELAEDLVRHPGEDAEEYSERRARFRPVNMFAPLVDQFADSVYGSQPERKLVETGGAAGADELYEQTLEYNDQDTLFLEVGLLGTRDGNGWVVGDWFEEDRQVALHIALDSNILFGTHPNHPRKIVDLIERRGEDPEEQRFRVWTPEFWLEVDRDGGIVGDVERNAWGMIPYAHYRGRPVPGSLRGCTWVKAILHLQQLLNMRQSDFDRLMVEQAHGTLVLPNSDDAEAEMGPKRAITDADAKFIQPGAELEQMRLSLFDVVKFMFQVGRIPMVLLEPKGAESGLKLALEFAPFMQVVEKMRTHARSFEKQVAQVVVAIGRANGMPFPEEIKPNCTWTNKILPTDREQEQRWDLALLESNLLRITQFLRKHNPEVTDEDSARAYLETLLREQSEAAQILNRAPAGAPPPPRVAQTIGSNGAG